MGVAFIALVVLLPESPKPAKPTSIVAPFKALTYPGLLLVSVTALLYNYGFFTLLAYTPFPLNMGTYSIGFIFFGWGLLLALSSAVFAPKLQRAFGTVPMMALALALFAADLAAMAVFTDHKPVLIIGTVLAGLFLGVNNTLITEAVMEAAPSNAPPPRPPTASSASPAAPPPPTWQANSANTRRPSPSGAARPAPPRSPSCAPAESSCPTWTITPPPPTPRRRPRPSPSAKTDPAMPRTASQGVRSVHISARRHPWRLLSTVRVV